MPLPGDDVGPPPALVKKPFPTGWVVGIGGGVAVLGLVAYLVWGGGATPSRPRVATDPERRPERKPKRRRAVRRPQRKKAA